MWNPLLSSAEKKISHTDYTFDYFGEPVKWSIVQMQTNNDFSFDIICRHSLFLKFFPEGEAKITGLLRRSKDPELERAERMFFRNMIDSCEIS